MNEIEFYNAASRLRKRQVAALRQLRDISKNCKCERCKTTVVACRLAIKRG